VSDLSYLEAVVIGGLQGVTELFPISSLGHSVLLPAWVGGDCPHLVTEQSTPASERSPYLAFIVAVHCATALALLVFYWRAWVRIIGGLLTSIRHRSITTPTQRLGWLIVAAPSRPASSGCSSSTTYARCSQSLSRRRCS